MSARHGRAAPFVAAFLLLATVPALVPAAQPAFGGFEETFDAEPVTSGTWDANFDGDGAYQWSPGEVRLYLHHGVGAIGGGLERPLTVTAPELRLDVTVTPHTLYRFGVILWAGQDRVQLEVDEWGFCLCHHKLSDGKWSVNQIGSAVPAVGGTYTASLTLRNDNTASASASGGTFEAVGVKVRAQDVTKIELRVWRGYTEAPRSDYTVHHLRVSSGDLPGAPQDLAATPGPTGGQVTLTWSPPASDGGTAIAAYRVYAREGSGSLTLVGQVGGAARVFVDEEVAAGPAAYAVSAVNAAGEGPLSETAVTRAFARYVVELRAWIPHARIVDPLLPDESGYNWARAFVQGGGACNERASSISTAWGWYAGDDHIGVAGTFRVRTMLELDWDGERIIASDARPSEPHFGATEQWRRYLDYESVEEECLLRSAVATEGWEATVDEDGDGFLIRYSARIPILANHPLIPEGEVPPIDGVLIGNLVGDGSLSLAYQTDQFPSHGFTVRRNEVLQLTTVSTDASCLAPDEVMGDEGLENVETGLTTSQATGFVTLSPTDAGRFVAVVSELCT